MSEEKTIQQHRKEVKEFLKELGDEICDECPLYKRFLREKQSGEVKKHKCRTQSKGAETMNDIFFFIREEPYGFLSNLQKSTQIVDGIKYDSNERYYQCQKPRDQVVADWIYNVPSPYLAMVVGHNLRPKEIREDWTVEVRLATMLKGLKAKFTQNPDLAKQLLDTGDAILHENNRDDPFWGVGNKKNKLIKWESQCVGYKGCGYRGPEENFKTGMAQHPLKCPKCGKTHTFMAIRIEMGDNLGKLLMQVREELKQK